MAWLIESREGVSPRVRFFVRNPGVARLLCGPKTGFTATEYVPASELAAALAELAPLRAAFARLRAADAAEAAARPPSRCKAVGFADGFTFTEAVPAYRSEAHAAAARERDDAVNALLAMAYPELDTEGESP